MPHRRTRHIVDALIKRSRLFPVIGLIGPRQVGKSTFFRDTIAAKIGATYVTFDTKTDRVRATDTPTLFLKGFEDAPLVIDEAQKVPDIFDAIKNEVDIRRRPGRYFVTGSTQFSEKVGIRESLTGRIGLFQMYPLTLAETEEAKFRAPWVDERTSPLFNEKQLLQRLTRGGMPGICFLRSEAERSFSFDQWLDTTCHRDIHQVRKYQLDGNLAEEILRLICTLEDPVLSEIARRLGQSARRVGNHLEALEILMAVTRLDATAPGVGRSRYYIFDSGMAGHCGAERRRMLLIWALNECLAQNECAGRRVRIHYYRSAKRSNVDFVVRYKNEIMGVILTEKESVDTYTLRTAEAFLKKIPTAHVVILAPVSKAYRVGKNVRVAPWWAMG